MKNILDEIIANTKTEIQQRKKQNSHNFLALDNSLKLIAEVKFKSPSAGILNSDSDVISRVKEYEKGGADAISVITDSKFFGGSLELLKKIKQETNLPILQKDFIVDEYQIFESFRYQANALLLITRIIDTSTLQKFVDLCLDLSIEPLVEVYDETDLIKALKTHTRYIGVNARNLDTFEVNIEKACEIGKQIPDEKIFVGLSGVDTADHVKQYKKAGAKAIVVGTSLMKSRNIQDTIKNFKNIS